MHLTARYHMSAGLHIQQYHAYEYMMHEKQMKKQLKKQKKTKKRKVNQGCMQQLIKLILL